MAGVAGTIKLPAVTDGLTDGGPEIDPPADVQLLEVLTSFSMTLTPFIVTEVGSPISRVAAEVGAAGGGTFGL